MNKVAYTTHVMPFHDSTPKNKLFRVLTKRIGVRLGLYSNDERGLIRKFRRLQARAMLFMT